MIISLQAIENEKVTRISMEKYHIPYEIIVGKGMCHGQFLHEHPKEYAEKLRLFLENK